MAGQYHQNATNPEQSQNIPLRVFLKLFGFKEETPPKNGKIFINCQPDCIEKAVK
jgi:hypothetical protein